MSREVIARASVLAAHTAPAEVAIESGVVASSHRKFPPLAPALILFYRASVHAVIEVINVNHSVDTEDGMHSKT